MVVPQLPQFVDSLEGTAPAGTAVIDLIETAPVISPVVTDLERLFFGDAPVYKRVSVMLDTLRLVCGDANIVERVIFAL